MASIFDQLEQTAQRQGAGPVLDEAKKAAMKGAAGLAAMALGSGERRGHPPDRSET
jgi:hypothetical protein